MILRIKNSKGDIIPVTKILKITAADSSIKLSSGGDKAVTISNELKTYEDWYNLFITKKINAFITGGYIAGKYDITAGISSYIYNEAGSGYLRTINSVSPDKRGNIQLLPGNTLDITANDGSVVFSRLDTKAGDGVTSTLVELNRMVWYLYHAQNSLIYRLNLWAPDKKSSPMFIDSRFLGVIPSYQAAVAAWNMKIWRKSFLWEISPIRESISFSIGYMALSCVNPSVRCEVKIKNTAPADDTTKLLTVYDQGVATNLEGTISRRITKLTGSDDFVISGNGSDPAVEEGYNWSAINIEIDIGAMAQGDYYKAAFSLAVAHGEATVTSYQSVSDVKHQMTIEVIWVMDDDEGNKYGFAQDIYVPALNLYPEDDEGDYI